MNENEKIIFDALKCISDMAILIGDAVNIAENEENKDDVMSAVNKFENEITPIYDEMLNDVASGLTESGTLLTCIEGIKEEQN